MNKKEFINSKVEMVDGVLLLNNQYALMYEHEKEEIQKQVKEICEKHKPKKVLEIGFGLGYSAEAFQEYGLDKHVIVEAHPEIYKKAHKWQLEHKNYKNIEILYEFIQDDKIDENEFDIVFDDRCELVYNVPQGMGFPYYKVTKESKSYSLPPIKSW